RRLACCLRLRNDTQRVARNDQIEEREGKRAEQEDDGASQQIAGGVFGFGDGLVLFFFLQGVAEERGQRLGLVAPQPTPDGLIEPEQDEERVGDNIRPGVSKEVLEALRMLNRGN